MLPFMMQNLHSSAIKKYLFELLKGKYVRNEKFIDRISASITTKEDYESLGSLVVDIFETGFLKAVDEYRGQLAKMGLKVSIVPEKKPNDSSENSIFGQPEKSG
jgi:hypothetical protein